MGAPYVPRLADATLASLFAELPALMVTGPRAAGKTTSARRLANDILRLDEASVATAVAADPDAALRRAREPVLIDEWQEVPEILGAVKRAVDDNPRPGRYLLTGSVEAALRTRMWPGTGRVVHVVMYGLTERERAGRADAAGVFPALLEGAIGEVGVPGNRIDLADYVDLAVRGGLPQSALAPGDRASAEWRESYLDLLVSRDVDGVGESRDPVRLRRYVTALALMTAGLPTSTTLDAAAGIARATGDAYDRLLSNVYLLDLVPAWTSNRLSRLTKASKRYLTDSGLAATAAAVDAMTVLRDGDLVGRLLDTFVAAQLRPELATMQPRPRMFHIRTDGGREEVDLVIDLGAGRVIAIEVKATSAPDSRDARHLRWLRDRLGDRFVRGVVFHTGPLPFEMHDRIWALPISALWTAP